MIDWPTSWRENLLRHAGIPVSRFALDILSAWEKSTPTQPWTNNPLGLSAKQAGMPPALNTPYAVFPSHGHFRVAFGQLIQQPPGSDLALALLNEGDHAGIWRVINGLNLPANQTETDYPANLMDMIESKYRVKLKPTKPSKRRSAGGGEPVVNPHHPVILAAKRLHKASAEFQSLNDAIRHITRGLS